MKTYQVSQSLIENHEQATGKIWELQESSRDGVPNRMFSVCYLIYTPCYTMNLLLGCPMFSSKNLCGLKSQCSSPPAFQANRFPSKLSPSNPERLWPSTTGAAHCARTRGHKSRMPRKNQCHRRRNNSAMAFSAGVGPPPRGKVAAYTSQSRAASQISTHSI